MLSFTKKLQWVINNLKDNEIPFAIGGALALSFYADDPRNTRDIDINIWSKAAQSSHTFDVLSPMIPITEEQIQETLYEKQIRLLWDDVPVDLFFMDRPLNEKMSTRTVTEYLGDLKFDILSVTDLVICKSIFSRMKDWADIETIINHPDLDKNEVSYWLDTMLGPDSPERGHWERACNHIPHMTIEEYQAIPLPDLASQEIRCKKIVASTSRPCLLKLNHGGPCRSVTPYNR
jgi:hypothetical protein